MNSRRFVRSNREKVRKEGDFVYLLKGGFLYKFENVSKEIWDILKQPKTIDEVVRELKQTYVDIEIETLKSDALEFIQQGVKEDIFSFE